MTNLTQRFDFDNYFSVLFDKQTYINLFYLFLSFPLGIAYFVLVVTGASVGGGLSVIGVGLAILLVLMALVRGLASLERQMVRLMLNRPMATVKPRALKREGLFGRIQDLITDPYTYRATLFALLKFPLGIASFVIAVVAIAIPSSFVAAPFMYQITHYEVFPGIIINNLSSALTVAAIGVVLLPIAAHTTNLWTDFCAAIARITLSADTTFPNAIAHDAPAASISTEEEIVILKEAEQAKSSV